MMRNTQPWEGMKVERVVQAKQIASAKALGVVAARVFSRNRKKNLTGSERPG